MGAHFMPAMVPARRPASRDCLLDGTSTATLALKGTGTKMGLLGLMSLHGGSEDPSHPAETHSSPPGRGGPWLPQAYSRTLAQQRSLARSCWCSLKYRCRGVKTHSPVSAFTPSNSPREQQRLLARSQNGRRHPFGKKGHAPVLYLVLVGEAPTLLRCGL